MPVNCNLTRTRNLNTDHAQAMYGHSLAARQCESPSRAVTSPIRGHLNSARRSSAAARARDSLSAATVGVASGPAGDETRATQTASVNFKSNRDNA